MCYNKKNNYKVPTKMSKKNIGKSKKYSKFIEKLSKKTMNFKRNEHIFQVHKVISHLPFISTVLITNYRKLKGFEL